VFPVGLCRMADRRPRSVVSPPPQLPCLTSDFVVKPDTADLMGGEGVCPGLRLRLDLSACLGSGQAAKVTVSSRPPC
jgi:hypothetical protein